MTRQTITADKTRPYEVSAWGTEPGNADNTYACRVWATSQKAAIEQVKRSARAQMILNGRARYAAEAE